MFCEDLDIIDVLDRIDHEDGRVTEIRLMSDGSVVDVTLPTFG